jgi:hypothetical protein
VAVDHDERLLRPPPRPTGQHVHALARRQGGCDVLVEPFQEGQDGPVDAGVQNVRVGQRIPVCPPRTGRRDAGSSADGCTARTADRPPHSVGASGRRDRVVDSMASFTSTTMPPEQHG